MYVMEPCAPRGDRPRAPCALAALALSNRKRGRSVSQFSACIARSVTIRARHHRAPGTVRGSFPHRSIIVEQQADASALQSSRVVERSDTMARESQLAAEIDELKLRETRALVRAGWHVAGVLMSCASADHRGRFCWGWRAFSAHAALCSVRVRALERKVV